MSKLEELIRQLCPGGVEYKPIKEVYQRLRGTSITASKMKDIASKDGEVRVFAGGKTIIDAHKEDIPNANITKVPAVIVQSRGVIDAVYYDRPFTFKNEMWAYTHKEKVSVKYLYYILKNNIEVFREAASGMGSLPQISMKVTEDFKIPVPPLEIQREIVRILDHFTELTAELTARKKQYNYYLDALIVSECTDKVWALKDVCLSIADGDHMPPPKADSGVPFITISNITKNKTIDFSNVMYVPRDYYNKLADKRKARQQDVLYTVVGSFGIPVYVADNTEFVFQRHIAILRPDKKQILPRYMYFAIQTSDFFKQADKAAKGAAQRTIGLASLGNMKIYVPSLEEQRRIVSILDRFDALCNDLTSGLPAEIAARQKQYEYYRDKLLSFKEKVS